MKDNPMVDIHQPIDKLPLATDKASQAVLGEVKAKIKSDILKQCETLYNQLVADYFKELSPLSSDLLDIKITKNYKATIDSYVKLGKSTLAYFLYRMGCGDYYGTTLFYHVAHELKIALPNEIIGKNDEELFKNLADWITKNKNLVTQYQLSSFDPMYRAESYANKKKDFIEKLVAQLLFEEVGSEKYQWKNKWHHEETVPTELIQERYKQLLEQHDKMMMETCSSDNDITPFAKVWGYINEFASYGTQAVHFFLERMSEGDENAGGLFHCIASQLGIEVPYHLYGTTMEERQASQLAFIASLNRPELNRYSPGISAIHRAHVFIPYFQSLEEGFYHQQEAVLEKEEAVLEKEEVI